MSETETGELYKKHRPRSFAEVAGQKEAIKLLTDMGKRQAMPHALLFTGPSGCGKTTLARIVAKKLNCSEYDFLEMNAASARGIDTIRDIERYWFVSPLGGKCKVYLLDEAHALTGDAQTALLKLLEDMPPTVYFMLATTDPAKLKKTIITRCTQITCKLLSDKEAKDSLLRVLELESKTLDDRVVNKIVEAAAGSARKALVILHSLLGIESADDQLEVIEKADQTKAGFDLARALFSGKPSWSTISGILKVTEEDPETIRRIVVGYAKSVLLNSGSSFAHLVIEVLREPLFDASTASALLASSCYAIVQSK